MNLLHLEYFKLVAETENISKAASEAYISASGLSKVINRLENEIGYPLFERFSNRLILNESGKIFYDFADNVLRQNTECMEKIREQADEAEKQVTISIPAECLISGIIDHFQEENPEIRFNQYVMSSYESHNALENREIDFAICHKAIEEPGIIWTPLTQQPMCLAVGKSHPLAQENVESIDLKDLKDELFFLQATSVDERNLVINWCREAGFAPRVYQSSPELTFKMIEKGVGVAFIQEYFFGNEEQQRFTGQFLDGNKIAHRITLITPECILPTGIARKEGRILTNSAWKFYRMICRYYCVETDL